MKAMSRQLVSGEEAEEASFQHRLPCADCPFTRTALRGWLGSMSVEVWLMAAHGESRIDCHAKTDMQCAGAAIYRANMAKLCRSPDALRLPPNRKLVFATPAEFSKHHKIK